MRSQSAKSSLTFAQLTSVSYQESNSNGSAPSLKSTHMAYVDDCPRITLATALANAGFEPSQSGARSSSYHGDRDSNPEMALPSAESLNFYGGNDVFMQALGRIPSVNVNEVRTIVLLNTMLPRYKTKKHAL